MKPLRSILCVGVLAVLPCCKSLDQEKQQLPHASLRAALESKRAFFYADEEIELDLAFHNQSDDILLVQENSGSGYETLSIKYVLRDDSGATIAEGTQQKSLPYDCARYAKVFPQDDKRGLSSVISTITLPPLETPGIWCICVSRKLSYFHWADTKVEWRTAYTAESKVEVRPTAARVPAHRPAPPPNPK